MVTVVDSIGQWSIRPDDTGTRAFDLPFDDRQRVQEALPFLYVCSQVRMQIRSRPRRRLEFLGVKICAKPIDIRGNAGVGNERPLPWHVRVSVRSLFDSQL